MKKHEADFSGDILVLERELDEVHPTLGRVAYYCISELGEEPRYDVLSRRRLKDGKVVTVAEVDGVEMQFERDATESDVLPDTL